MYKTLYAITQIIGNEETVIRTFSEKDDAFAFGPRYRSSTSDGVITLIQADFDEALRMKDHTCRVFEVWE